MSFHPSFTHLGHCHYGIPLSTVFSKVKKFPFGTILAHFSRGSIEFSFNLFKGNNNEMNGSKNQSVNLDQLVCVQDFEDAAFKILDLNALNYYRSGADDEITLRDNEAGFKRYMLRPRMLRDVSHRDISTTVLGAPVAFPLGVSPTAMQKMATPEGEKANARAAEAMGTIFILSTLSTTSLEDVAEAAPNGRKWFQLYVYKDRNVSESLVRRAERAGFEALVLTVDAPLFGKRRVDRRNKFNLPAGMSLANFQSGTTDADGLGGATPGESALDRLNQLLDQSLDWSAIDWLRSITGLPILVKGILTPEDAELAVDHGVDGIIVSNHGGRQLDTVSATIDALPAIVRQVYGRCEVFMDGGVREGTDIFKALAFGAKMVFIGRPMLWGMAVDGENGAKKVLTILKQEFDLTMALTGVTNAGNITEEYIGPARQACPIVKSDY